MKIFSIRFWDRKSFVLADIGSGAGYFICFLSFFSRVKLRDFRFRILDILQIKLFDLNGEFFASTKSFLSHYKQYDKVVELHERDMTSPPKDLKANLLFFIHPNVCNCEVTYRVDGEVKMVYEDNSDWKKIIISNLKESLVENGAAVLFFQTLKEFNKTLGWLKSERGLNLNLLFAGPMEHNPDEIFFRFGIYVNKVVSEMDK